MKDILPAGTLVIAEKSSLAEAIARAFPTAPRRQGYFDAGNHVRIGWARGHLFEMADFDHYIPQDFRGSWAKSRSMLPLVPERLKRVYNGADGKKAYETLRDLIAEARLIVHAGDPDREGQGIVDDILEQAGWRGPVRRLWTTALDPKSILEALARMKDNNSYRALWYAQRCRRDADYLVGMNFTRIYSVDGGQFYRVGRVKTPTLALVVWRDREIAGFRSRDYYLPVIAPVWEGSGFDAGFDVSGPDFPARMDDRHRLLDRAQAQGILDAGRGDPAARVVESNFEDRSQIAPLPYSTLELQKAASARFGFTAQRTLDLADSLYKKGITTYPRVDCRYFPESFLETAIASMRPYVAEFDLDLDRRHPAFNDRKIAEHAHYAIGLTGERGEMTPDEVRVYELVRDTIAALFAPPWRYRTGVLRIQSGIWSEHRLVWKATSRRTVAAGWSGILRGTSEDSEEDSALPEIPVGTVLAVPDGRLLAKKTEPPAHYTDATLVAAMDNVHRVIDDPKAKAILKEASGIGTNATRATVIEELVSGGLVARQKKLIKASPAGHSLIDSLESVKSPIADPVLTAAWEEKLSTIASLPPEEAEPAYRHFMGEMVDAMRVWAEARIAMRGGEPCPDCAEPACRKFKSRKSGLVFWGCSACQNRFADEKGRPGRKFEATVQQAGESCPKCRVEAVVRRESQKKPGVFYWRCTACHKNFADDSGRPGRDFDEKPPVRAGDPCPKCRKPAAVRLESQKKPGVFYWRCTACQAAFGDNAGQCGAEFGAATKKSSAGRPATGKGRRAA